MKIQESERFRVGALLAIAGGILDAYTYICRGGVFANAQTGNIVLIGIRAVDGDWRGMFSAIVPVIAFAIGVLITEQMKLRFKTEEMHRFHWRHVMVGIEIALIAAISFVPQGEFDHFVNVIISFVCAMQVQTFRKVRGFAFASTMCTGNLRSGTEALSNYIHKKNRKERHRMLCSYGIIAFFIFGAIAGALLSVHSQTEVLPVCVLIYAIIFVFMIEWNL